MGRVLVVISVLFLAGCIGDQRNRQGVTFDGSPGVAWARPSAPGTTAEAPPVVVPNGERSQADGGEGGTWRRPRGGILTDAPDTVVSRTEWQASQNATQNSITGLGLQLGKVGERVEGIHSELGIKIANTASASAEATVKLRAELSATIDNQATVNAKATADLRAELKAELHAQALAFAQLQGQVVAGVNNRNETTTTSSMAGRDSTQISFTPAMAEMFKDMMDKFCQMTRSEMHTLAYITTGISTTFAGIISTMAGLVAHRASKRHNTIVDQVLGSGAAEAKKVTARLSGGAA